MVYQSIGIVCPLRTSILILGWGRRMKIADLLKNMDLIRCTCLEAWHYHALTVIQFGRLFNPRP
jgi:hypothetical protein